MSQPVNAFSERVPPQNLEAEQSVLAACLIDRDSWAQVQPTLNTDDFYAEKHGIIYEAMQRAHAAGNPVDLITVQDQLRKPAPNGDGTLLDLVGGITYLTSLTNLLPSTANVAHYAGIVAHKAAARRLQTVWRKGIDALYDEADIEIAMGDVQAGMDKNGRTGAKMALKPIAGRIGAYANQRYQNRNKPNADWIPSRFGELRSKCPIMKREVSLISGPPGHGKTTLAMSDAYFQATVGYHVAIFELENADEQMFDKLIAQAARLPVRAIRMGLMDDPDWFVYQRFAQELDALETLSLNTATVETMGSIRWQCLKMKAEKGLDVVYIDFLDRITEQQRKDERYDQLVARIVGIAKEIARECNCHVFILAQIDTKVTQRPNPVPGQADLANSKTNLAGWPDNIITCIQPSRCKGGGDGKARAPAIYGVPCSDKRWKNVLVLSVAKGRFSEPDALIPVYAEFSTGFLGSLRKPWPWFDNCPDDQVGLWNEEEDKAHKAAMIAYREQAVAAEADSTDDLVI